MCVVLSGNDVLYTCRRAVLHMLHVLSHQCTETRMVKVSQVQRNMKLIRQMNVRRFKQEYANDVSNSQVNIIPSIIDSSNLITVRFVLQYGSPVAICHGP